MKNTQKSIITFLFIALAALTAFAQKDDKKSDDSKRNWQTGKVLDTESRNFTTTSGSTTTGQVNNNGTYSASTNETSWNHNEGIYNIEGDEYIYVIRRIITFRWEKAASLTVNAPIKFAVEKDKLYFVDDNGREMKGKIVKKILKQPAGS